MNIIQLEKDVEGNITATTLTEDDLRALEYQAEILAKLCGFQNNNEMQEFRLNAQMGMIRFGGSFSQSLGHALAHADSENTSKIIRNFRDVCESHAKLHLKFMANRTKKQEVGDDEC